MKKVKKMALGGMGAKTQSQLQASVPRTQSQMQNAAQEALKSAGMNVPNLPKMTGPLGSVRKPPATPPAGLNLAGIRQAPAGLGDTFKGNPNIQKTDTSTGGPPLQRLSTPEQYKQAEAAYKQMQQQQQLANSVGRLPSVTAGLGQLAKGATMAVPARGISRGDLRMAGLKKGGAVKSSASKRGDGIAQRGKTKGRIV